MRKFLEVGVLTFFVTGVLPFTSLLWGGDFDTAQLTFPIHFIVFFTILDRFERHAAKGTGE